MIAICHLCGKAAPTTNTQTYTIESEDWMNYLSDNPGSYIVSIFYRYTWRIMNEATKYNLAFPTTQFFYCNLFLLYIPLLLILSLLAACAFYLYAVLVCVTCCSCVILLIIGFIMNEYRWRDKNARLRENLLISSIANRHYRWIASTKRKEAGTCTFQIGVWCLYIMYMSIWFFFIWEFQEIYWYWIDGHRPCKHRDAENHLNCEEFGPTMDDYGLLIFAVILAVNLIRYALEWVYVIKSVDGKIIYDIHTGTGEVIMKDYMSFLFDPPMWRYISFLYPDIAQVMMKGMSEAFERCGTGNKYLYHVALWIGTSAVLTVVPFHWVLFVEERMRFEVLLPLGFLWVSFMIVRITRAIVKILV